MPAESTPVINSEFLFFGIFGLVTLAGVIGVTAWFIYRYNHKRHPVAADISGNPWLEAAWIVLPTLIALGMFRIGLTGYLFDRTEPPGGITVKVTAFRYGWRFDYENGRHEEQLYVPVGEAVHLRITSDDVIHDFYVPAFRLKQDAVPRITNRMWFRATQVGEYDVMCAEYCGIGHSQMNTKVVVLPKDRFDAWYRSPEDSPQAEGAAKGGEREGGAEKSSR